MWALTASTATGGMAWPSDPSKLLGQDTREGLRGGLGLRPTISQEKVPQACRGI